MRTDSYAKQIRKYKGKKQESNPKQRRLDELYN